MPVVCILDMLHKMRCRMSHTLWCLFYGGEKAISDDVRAWRCELEMRSQYACIVHYEASAPKTSLICCRV